MDKLMIMVKKVQRAGMWFVQLPLKGKICAAVGLVVAVVVILL